MPSARVPKKARAALADGKTVRPTSQPKRQRGGASSATCYAIAGNVDRLNRAGVADVF